MCFQRLSLRPKKRTAKYMPLWTRPCRTSTPSEPPPPPALLPPLSAAWQVDVRDSDVASPSSPVLLLSKWFHTFLLWTFKSHLECCFNLLLLSGTSSSLLSSPSDSASPSCSPLSPPPLTVPTPPAPPSPPASPVLREGGHTRRSCYKGL